MQLGAPGALWYVAVDCRAQLCPLCGTLAFCVEPVTHGECAQCNRFFRRVRGQWVLGGERGSHTGAGHVVKIEGVSE